MAKRKKPAPAEPATEADPGSPGWDAISAAFDRLYPGQEPRHYGTIVKWWAGGSDPLDGISAYKVAEPRPHWHIVSYGMSELHAKESRNPDVSGWGFEFTFRVARKPRDREPPGWALNFLQNLGRYVFETGNVFGANHHIDLNGPIALGQDTLIRAVAFAHDPQLPRPIDTPNGRLEFLQVVGITPDEYAAIMDWNTAGFLRVLARRDPLLITDLGRPSILDDPATARRVLAAAAREGSSLEGVRSPELRWRVNARGKPPRATVTLGAAAVDRVVRMLAGRTLHGRPFDLWGPRQTIRFVPGKRAGWKTDGGVLTVRLTEPLAEEVRATLAPRRGDYAWVGLPHLTLTVTPTEIRDHAGEVVEVVG